MRLVAGALLLLGVLAGCSLAPGALGSGAPDSGAPDSGAPDSGTPDSGTPDSGTPDSGTPDSGAPDSGSSVRPVPTDAMMYTVAAGPFDSCSGKGPDLDIEWAPFDFSSRHRLGPSVNTPDDELWPRLSPDRSRFVFYRLPVGFSSEFCRYSREELWLANVDGSGTRRIFSRADLEAVGRSLGWPTDHLLQGHADWSPDGVHVVMFLGRYIDFFVQVPVETQLFVLDVDTGALRQLTSRRAPQSGDGISSDCSYSADGTQVVFVGCPDSQVAGCPTSSILSVPASATRATSAATLYALKSPNDVYASPDGTRLAWMEPFNWEIKVAPYRLAPPLDAGEVRLVEPMGGFGSWTRDDRFVFGRGSALFINDLDGGASRQLSPQGSPEVFILPSP